MGLISWYRNKKAQKLMKEKEAIEERFRNRIVDYAFDTFLKEGEDYTVEAKVDGAVLVKKIGRFAELDITKPYAMFSIETDKGLYCFQLVGESMSMVQTDVMLSVYPQLAPEGYDLPKEKYVFVPNEENQSTEQTEDNK